MVHTKVFGVKEYNVYRLLSDGSGGCHFFMALRRVNAGLGMVARAYDPVTQEVAAMATQGLVSRH